MNPVVLALGAAGLAAVLLWRRGGPPGDAARPGAPEPLFAGVPYLFVVRLDPETTEETALTVLVQKRAERVVFGPASVPPVWTKPGEAYGSRAVSFTATPNGNGQVTLGDPFYGIGRIESLVRLDGMPFSHNPEASSV